MNLSSKAVLFLATGFGAGRIPFAPGTFGSLAGLPFCLLLASVSRPVSAALLAGLILISVPVASRAARMLGKKDPGAIVIDEMAGISVTLWGIPFQFLPVCAGFLIFRVLDIAKPFPVGYLDKTLSGGTGIVADDLAAGLIGNLLLRAFLALSGWGA
ncbi:MAG: phosphatidylglycerophosphatase A [Desulfobacterales bacterium]|nr:phosphatidylglycerophosphatase A [Desulfobacterales bacterium]